MISDKELHELIDKVACDRCDTIIIIHRKPNDWMKAVIAHKDESSQKIVYTLVTDGAATNWRELLASDAWKREPTPIPEHLSHVEKVNFIKSQYVKQP